MFQVIITAFLCIPKVGHMVQLGHEGHSEAGLQPTLHCSDDSSNTCGGQLSNLPAYLKLILPNVSAFSFWILSLFKVTIASVVCVLLRESLVQS